MKNETMLLHYALDRRFNNDPLNAIGATESTTLRNVTTHTDLNTKYVKKFGTDYAIGDITNAVIDNPRSDGGGVNKWWFEFYNENDTLLATVKDENGVSTFVDGTAEASIRVYIKIVRQSGTITITNGDVISLATDIDADLDVFLPGETMAPGFDDLLLALSETGSTYYMTDTSDNQMVYGGFRHVEDGTAKYPYFRIQDGIDDVVLSGGAFTIVTCLGNGEVFDEEIDSDYDGLIVQSVLGFINTITRGIGARVTKNPKSEYNNTSAMYVNSNGNDANNGTWQNPKKTLQDCVDTLEAAASSNFIVYGGDGAPINSNNNDTVIEPAGDFELKMDVDYFFLPVYNNSGVVINCTSSVIYLNVKEIYGVTFNANSAGIVVDHVPAAGVAVDFTMEDCSFTNVWRPLIVTGFSNLPNINIKRCLFDSIFGILSDAFAIAIRTRTVANIDKCIFTSCYNGIRILPLTTTAVNINNCIFNNIDNIAVDASANGGIINLEVNENTFYNIRNASISMTHVGFAVNETIENNIFQNISTVIFSAQNRTIDFNCLFDYTNDIDGGGVLTSNNEISTDPKLCDPLNGFFGIQPISPCYRSAKDSDDVGARTRIIEINESNIEFNGFIIDGQNSYSSGFFILDTINHTGFLSKWNTIINHIGQPIDLYDDDTALDAQILNTNINNNGSGITFKTGGNLVQECLICKNRQQGIYCKGIEYTINHNVIFQNNQGLYFDTGLSSLLIKNNIISENAISIFSEVTISSGNIINNNIVDGVSDIVDISDISNIIANSLFINTITVGSENFNIKTTETNIIDDDGNIIGQYTVNSPCKNAGDDGFDMGAYKVDREKIRDWFSKFRLYNNPFEMNPDIVLKGAIDFENAKGGPFKLGKSHKWVFPFTWADDDDQTEDQVDIMRYISTLVETDKNGLTGDLVNILIHLLPDELLLTGTGGTIDSSGKTLSDPALDLKPNKFKGFHIGIKFFKDTNLIIDAALKTGTKVGAGWTVDEWKDYFIYHNNYYYLITGNTATVLTLSDPFDTLTDQTISDFSIEKYFKILANSKNQFLLEDDNGELISGALDYYIDFIIMKAANDNFQPLQEGFFYKRLQSKTGFSLIFQEK